MSKITIDREVLDQAIDALYPERDHTAQGQHYVRHIDAMTREGLHSKSRIAGELAARDIEIEQLRAAMAAIGAQQEPVGMTFDEAYASLNWADWRMRPVKELLAELHRLTSPPASKPLSSDQLGQMWRQATQKDEHWMEPIQEKFARAVEAAHGIKETK